MPASLLAAAQALALAAALLVVVSGAAKLRSPGPSVRMITALRLPGWTRLPHGVRLAAARGVGMAEVVTGLGVVAIGGRWFALALTVLYAGFAATVIVSLVRGAGVGCGCFGDTDAAPGRAHVAVDAVAGLAALATVFHPLAALGGIGDHAALTSLVLVLQVLLLAALGYLSLTALPELAGIRRRVAEEV